MRPATSTGGGRVRPFRGWSAGWGVPRVGAWQQMTLRPMWCPFRRPLRRQLRRQLRRPNSRPEPSVRATLRPKPAPPTSTTSPGKRPSRVRSRSSWRSTSQTRTTPSTGPRATSSWTRSCTRWCATPPAAISSSTCWCGWRGATAGRGCCTCTWRCRPSATRRLHGACSEAAGAQLPAMWQQLLDTAGRVSRQAFQDVLQIRVGVVAVHSGRVHQAHHRGRALTRPQTPGE